MPKSLGRAALGLALICSTLAAVVLAPAVLVPAALAEPWKCCAYNDQPIGCRDSHSPDGTVRIVWEDGMAMTYWLVMEGFPLSTLQDSLGGIWEQRVFVQGNAEFTNPANGNRIFVPLR